MRPASPLRTLLAAGTATAACAATFVVSPYAANATAHATIAQIQGAAHRSPLEGNAVTDVVGVVTAAQGSGFWMQSVRPDNSPATSEGLYVYTRQAPTVKVGDRVSVAGTVSEYRAGNAVENLTTTQLIEPTVAIKASGRALPRPVVLGVDRTAPQQQIKDGDPGDVELADVRFAPQRNALDFYESLEGMRTGVRDAVATGPTNTGFGELAVVPGQKVQATRTRAGGVAYNGYQRPNAMRVILDDPLLADDMPVANVGDTLPGTSVGVLDYGFGNFKLLLTATPRLRSQPAEREVTRKPSKNEVSFATFNVENLSPSDPSTKFSRLAQQITTNLRSPDVLALEEIQDNSGSQDDGVVSSSTTVSTLVAAIKAAGGPTYEARSIDPEDKVDGGQPGGNIRTVFLYRPDRGMDFVDRSGGDATTPTLVQGRGGRTALSISPGRIDPEHQAWDDSRKPLVGEFRFRGESYFVIANHFASKGGDQPLFGRFQQPTRSSEVQRHQQARVVRGFVTKLLTANPKANVLVVGDLNDFEFSTTTDTLVGQGKSRLTDLPRTLPARDRYSYVFDGNSQVLDHILTSRGLDRKGVNYDIVHTNSDFHDQDSDHDPQIVRVRASR
ncbi:endonuclease/exonuclease/phosphatase family protein [Demetria terragena]|uniref:endonuclease/exonuclease/phosphatase family protein n=1 Tax=Demetria terragena TaxID=63959 RepID=UPI00035C4E29|nr:endonuclease/exonuclease/phosphatase family protein [Demetria terragena]